MSTSALLSALRVGGRQHVTASILAGRQHITAPTLGERMQATGSHVFRIDRFTRVKDRVANGALVRSGTFGVGGHGWRIHCYPNGNVEQTRGSMSLFLKQASHATTGDATATFKMSILDQSWKPSRALSMDAHRFTGDGWGWDRFIKLEDLEKDQKHLEDGCLSVLCDVTVDIRPSTYYKYIRLQVPAAPAAQELKLAPPPFELHGVGLAEAIWSKQAADVKIKLGDGQTLAAHRWVLEAQSPVFMMDLALASKTGNVTELRVDDMDADVCKALVQFMYTHSPPRELESMAGRLLAAADRYEVEKLKLICEEVLCKSIDTSSLAATLALAERHRCPVLWEACMKFLSSPGNMDVILASSDSLEKLKTGCQSALLELLGR
ncbi:hypothetical protein QYE76_035563 [Lolium multiflorum]|uniref:Uncharacterized protein n=1 Tax=Lolium multiflorum TaxID=4521 RepID=A0AAD8R0P1_LOLMU|nr:hypothetical protein QYE76_035563 [Lolium multiflorum]